RELPVGSNVRSPRWRLDLRHPSVTTIMTTNPASCTPHDAIDTVAQMMVEADCRAIPVVMDPLTRRVVGIITAFDIVRHVVAKERSGYECMAGTIMTPDPVTLHPGATVHEAARTMQARNVRRIPIVDDHGKLIGIVSQ